MVQTANPRQTILVACRGTANIFGRLHHLDEIYPTEWHTPISNAHKLYAIVIPKTHPVAEIIQKSKVFSINFISVDNKESIIIIRKHLGEIIDKFLLAGFTSVECEKIDCPRIQESAGFFECEVQQSSEAGDHIIFVAKVVHSEIKRTARMLFYIGGEEYTTTLK